MIRVITNSMGSGDWIVVQDTETGETLFEGHQIGLLDLVNILNFNDAQSAELVEVTDEQIEEGDY